VFAWFEDRLAPDRKKDITDLIKSTNTFARYKVSAESMERFHNGLFGDKQLSMKTYHAAVLRTARPVLGSSPKKDKDNNANDETDENE
jgi:hypothetical protein